MNKFAITAFALLALTVIAFANVPIVSIEMPSQPKNNEPVPVLVQVNHLGPGSGHYIDWIKVYSGERVVAEKTYSSPQRSDIFSEAINVTLVESGELRAEAHCTVHGPATSQMLYALVPAPTPLECHMSLCDCRCYPTGQTPEEKDGRMCGINCLGAYNATGCTVVNNVCTTVYGGGTPAATPTPTPEPQATPTPSASQCVSDEGCVPAQCCHPTSCVPAAQAPNCSDTACTMECREGTLDCSGGRCACINGTCGVAWPASPTPVMTAIPTPDETPTPAATPAPTPSGGDNTLVYLALGFIAVVVGIAAYFYLFRKEKPPEDYTSEKLPE